MSEETTKAPMGTKAGRLRITLDVEVNEELLDVAKEGIANMKQHMPNMMKRGMSGMGGDKNQEST